MAGRQELILFDLEECGARHRGSQAVRPFRANGMRAHIAFPHAHAVNNMMTKNLPSGTIISSVEQYQQRRLQYQLLD